MATYGYRMKKHKRRKRAAASLLILCLLLLCILFGEKLTDKRAAPGEYRGGLTVHFLNVGQADCALLLSDGEAMLIDAGNREDGDVIVRYLEEQGIEKLDYVVFSHPHEDHIGGGLTVLEEKEAGKIYALTAYRSKTAASLKKLIDRREIPVTMPRNGEVFSFGECSVEFLGPLTSYEDINDDSIVLKVTHGKNRFLFTGDAGRPAETDMLDAGFDLEAEVLKVGHHGSSTSTSYRFLRGVNPRYAVISCGRDNSYGHPHEETISRLLDARASILRTDEDGDIVIKSDGKGLALSP